MNQYPNLRLTLLLAFILLPPFALKTLKPHFEPYPAIILPSGVNRINVGAKDVVFRRTSLWGKPEKNNIWTRIDLETFWPPLPIQYFGSIVKNSLGLKLEEKGIIKRSQRINILRNKVTPREVDNAKRWWRQKLVQSGYSSDEIMITFEEVEFDIKTGKIITIKRIYEEIFRLD
jgi:hypothetical protein